MGLFDMFKGDKGQEMTPHKALTCSMLYVMASDGEIDPEEVGQLLSVIGGENRNGTIVVGGSNPNLLRESVEYIRKNSWTSFLDQIKEANILNEEQKLYIVTNMLDSSLSDGQAESQEGQMIMRFCEAFGISESQFKPYYDVIVFKNNRKIFK